MDLPPSPARMRTIHHLLVHGHDDRAMLFRSLDGPTKTNDAASYSRNTMAKFYLQTASDNTRTRTFRGQEPAHNHGASIKFSKKVRSLWVASFGGEPRLGDFQSGQSNPAADYTLRWNSGISDWEQT